MGKLSSASPGLRFLKAGPWIPMKYPDLYFPSSLPTHTDSSWDTEPFVDLRLWKWHETNKWCISYSCIEATITPNVQWNLSSHSKAGQSWLHQATTWTGVSLWNRKLGLSHLGGWILIKWEKVWGTSKWTPKKGIPSHCW